MLMNVMPGYFSTFAVACTAFQGHILVKFMSNLSKCVYCHVA